MCQLGIIRDKQAFSAAEIAREEYFFCGPSPEIFVFISNDLWNFPWFCAYCEIPNSLKIQIRLQSYFDYSKWLSYTWAISVWVNLFDTLWI